MQEELTNQALPVGDVGTPIALYHIYPPKKAALGRLSLVNDRTALEKANGWVHDVSVLVRQDDAEALLATKDAEIAALKEQLASLARGVKISIPTDTMEQEFQIHYRRGVASQAAEIAALKAERDGLKQDALRYREYRKGKALTIKCGNMTIFTGSNPDYERKYPEALDAAIDAALQAQAIAQAVQPTTKEKP